MKKIIALFLAALMLAACFAGCKKESKPLINVGYTIYSPMNYTDADGKLIGFDTDLAKAVFEGLGYEVKFKEIEWTAKYTDLNSGDIDCIWNGFTCNSADDDGVARSEKVDFSYKYMENRQIVVVKKDAAVAAMADLNGKRAVAEKGSAGEEFAKTVEGATVKTATKQTDCLMEIMSGTADFAVVDSLLRQKKCKCFSGHSVFIFNQSNMYSKVLQVNSRSNELSDKSMRKLSLTYTIHHNDTIT